MENQNKQRDVERELKELVQKYNVLDKSQLYAYFEKDGRERFVGRALKVLEKDRMIYVNNETKQVGLCCPGSPAILFITRWHRKCGGRRKWSVPCEAL